MGIVKELTICAFVVYGVGKLGISLQMIHFNRTASAVAAVMYQFLEFKMAK